METYPNITPLQRYVEAYWMQFENEIDPIISSEAKAETDRINKILFEAWPTLRARLQKFRPAFEIWVNDCIQRVTIKPSCEVEYFYAYRMRENGEEQIWDSGYILNNEAELEYDSGDAPTLRDVSPDILRDFQEAAITVSKAIWFKQLTNFDYAKEFHSVEFFDEDFAQIIEPQQEVKWFYSVECDPDMAWHIYSMDMEWFPEMEYYLDSIWTIVEDLLPPDIACLLRLKSPDDPRAD